MESQKMLNSLQILRDAAYATQMHKQIQPGWNEGKVVEAWHDKAGLCVKYENGTLWHYKDLDLAVPTFWRD